MDNLDSLDEKLYSTFPGRVVRKDLVRQMKSGVNVPVYVLEYLLGKYCSSTDEEIIQSGLEHVRTTLSEHYARPDESERVKSYIRERGRYRIIDKARVRLVESEDRYWAELMNMGVKNVDIPEKEVKRYDKLLLGGIWAILDIRYEPENLYRGKIRPFLIEDIKPIQLATLDMTEYAAKRASFTRNEWIDVLMRAIGMEPTHTDFNHRKKMLFISRLIPMVERNYNFVELGPRNTGKSFVFREISPNAILISGGKTTVASLFIDPAQENLITFRYQDELRFCFFLDFGNILC